MFKKGVSGNPSGRPKLSGPITDLARAETSRCIQTLIKMRDAKKAPAAARILAATALLDRGWGKPHQTTENHNFTRRVSDLTDDELARLLSERLLDGQSIEGIPQKANGSQKLN